MCVSAKTCDCLFMYICACQILYVWLLLCIWSTCWCACMLSYSGVWCVWPMICPLSKQPVFVCENSEPRTQITDNWNCMLSLLFVYSSSAFGGGLFKPPCVVVTLNHVHAYATKSFSTSFSLHVCIWSALSQRFSHQKRMIAFHLARKVAQTLENICRGALKLVWRLLVDLI